MTKQRYEDLCSDAIERIAVSLGIRWDLDDPEQVLVMKVEQRLSEIFAERNASGSKLQTLKINNGREQQQ